MNRKEKQIFTVHNGKTAWKQNWPMAFSRARVCTACRPRRGLGSGFYFPTWADLGPIITSRSSGSDGCTLLPAEQNWHSGQNPSAHQSSLPLSLSCAALQHRSDGRASDGRKMTTPSRAPSPVRAPSWIRKRRQFFNLQRPRPARAPAVIAVPERAAASGGSGSTRMTCGFVHSRRLWSRRSPHRGEFRTLFFIFYL
jgi:hypothetical protein